MKTGFVGWRGMVGSVLMDRMQQEQDFSLLEPTFFSTSQVGEAGPDVGTGAAPLEDAYALDALSRLDAIVSTQGGDYTKQVYPRLRESGWKGFWIDAASTLRMQDEAVLVLDPVNRAAIEQGIERGLRTYCGANCTVSLMLMALAGLFRAGQIEWLSSMTYQAASGAGAAQMRELVEQMAAISEAAREDLASPATSVLDLERTVSAALRDDRLPRASLGVPLAGSVLPWIDAPMPGGQTREEWKGQVETQKILGTAAPIPVDGICVRVGALRCHSQAFTIKLREALPLDEVEDLLRGANDWVRLIDNDRERTLSELTPAKISGTLEVPIGRLHKLNLGDTYLGAFSVGDQLLWGAAEPLRRVLRMIVAAQA